MVLYSSFNGCSVFKMILMNMDPEVLSNVSNCVKVGNDDFGTLSMEDLGES